MRTVSTFSIVAVCPDSGDLGVATASKFLAVGAVVPHARAGVGAVATQALANVSFGPRALAALDQGVPPELIREAFARTDPGHRERQYGIVAADGQAVSFTGAGCHAWAGGRSGAGLAVQGNLLTGPEVVDEAERAFRASEGPLAERLAAALTAGDRAGGDARGRQGAALLVVRAGGGYGGWGDRHVDLRVDDDPDPVPRLHELLRLQRLYAGPTDPDDVLDLSGAVQDRVVAVLARAERLPVGHEVWDTDAQAALDALIGTENLEERHAGPGRIDRVALEELERLYPG